MPGTVEVQLWSGLRSLTGGLDRVPVQAGTLREVLEALVIAHPGLAAPIAAGVSFAVDGRIVAGDLTTKVTPDTELVLMQRLRGG